MKMNKEKIELLKQKYSEIFSKKENRPKWAVKKYKSDELIHPSIPFVGKNYDSKILLYASAENLLYYIKNNKQSAFLNDNKLAINRHRFCFENYSNNNFFPNVHITPIQDGSLLTVTSYISKKILDISYENPYDLVENISLGNFGKFSIETKKENKDYANNYNYIKYSLPYIEADLSILKPEIIIMPTKIFENKYIKETINNILPKATVIPIYQINSRTINALRRPIIRKYKKKEIVEIAEFYKWQKHLSNGITGKTNNNFLSVYTYLDNVLNKINL